MAPLPITALADFLTIASGLWEPVRFEEYSGTGGSELLAAQLGPMLWGSSVETAPMPLAEAKKLRSKLLLLDGALNTFYFYSPENRYPVADPDGTILGASTVQVKSVGTDNASIALKGLPDNYVLTEGDMFSVDYGTRRALFALTEDGESNTDGETAELGVRPHVRPGIAADDSVTLIKPSAKVVILPNTLSIRPSSGTHAVIGFRVQQTLRAG